MIFYQDPEERTQVYLGNSVPCMLVGAGVGLMIGWLVSGACMRWPRVYRPLTLSVAVLLCAGIMAPIGWIVWVLADYPLRRREPLEGMIYGAITGSALGLVFGGLQLLMDHKGRRGDP
jgi:hypothetical protein